jgi:hypothetical protein
MPIVKQCGQPGFVLNNIGGGGCIRFKLGLRFEGVSMRIGQEPWNSSGREDKVPHVEIMH